MENFDHFEELRACRNLFLQNISEPRTNSLRVELIEGNISPVASQIVIAGQELGQGFEIVVDESCARYELLWNSYVLYQITNESFGRAEVPQEGMPPKLASIYRSSSLLEYVLRSTSASDEYPGKLVHYQFLCADHVIDVISSERPECRRISRKLPVN